MLRKHCEHTSGMGWPSVGPSAENGSSLGLPDTAGASIAISVRVMQGWCR